MFDHGSRSRVAGRGPRAAWVRRAEFFSWGSHEFGFGVRDTPGDPVGEAQAKIGQAGVILLLLKGESWPKETCLGFA